MTNPHYTYEKSVHVNYTLNAENINSGSQLCGSCSSCLDCVMPGAQVIFFLIWCSLFGLDYIIFLTPGQQA